MTYGRERVVGHMRILEGATVSHSAELVRGDSHSWPRTPLIGPSCRKRLRHDDPSPRGRRVAIAVGKDDARAPNTYVDAGFHSPPI
jgi:hypothetical protein